MFVRSINKSYVLLLLRILLALILILSGVGKLLSEKAATDFLSAFFFISSSLSLVVVALVASLEIIAGFALCLGLLLKPTLLFIAILLLVFTLLLIPLSIIKSEINCGCFGVLGEGETQVWLLITRNLVLLFITLLLLRYDDVEWSAISLFRFPHRSNSAKLRNDL